MCVYMGNPSSSTLKFHISLMIYNCNIHVCHVPGHVPSVVNDLWSQIYVVSLAAVFWDVTQHPLLWGTLWGERCVTSQKTAARAFSSPEPLSLICNEPVASPSFQDHLTKKRRALRTWRGENVRSSEHAGACTMAANEGVIKAVVNCYQDDSECGVSWSLLRSTSKYSEGTNFDWLNGWKCWTLAGIDQPLYVPSIWTPCYR